MKNVKLVICPIPLLALHTVMGYFFNFVLITNYPILRGKEENEDLEPPRGFGI